MKKFCFLADLALDEVVVENYFLKVVAEGCSIAAHIVARLQNNCWRSELKQVPQGWQVLRSKI